MSAPTEQESRTARDFTRRERGPAASRQGWLVTGGGWPAVPNANALAQSTATHWTHWNGGARLDVLVGQGHLRDSVTPRLRSPPRRGMGCQLLSLPILVSTPPPSASKFRCRPHHPTNQNHTTAAHSGNERSYAELESLWPLKQSSHRKDDSRRVHPSPGFKRRPRKPVRTDDSPSWLLMR